MSCLLIILSIDPDSYCSVYLFSLLIQRLAEAVILSDLQKCFVVIIKTHPHASSPTKS